MATGDTRAAPAGASAGGPASRRAVLATWPTPLEPAPRLAGAIGLEAEDLWIKRDDLCGLGGGGNKVRKLEWSCGAAVAEGADTLVTTGAAQSNHARLTAAAGARLGMAVVLVLAGSPPSEGSGNLALDGLFGARIVWAGDVSEALDTVASQMAEQLRREGARPALIPFGGSSVLSAHGYVECGRELLTQAPDLANVVLAVGSGGTMAGLVHALGAHRVLGVHCGAAEQPVEVVSRLVNGLGREAPGHQALRLRLDQVGSGYGDLTEPVMEAMRLAAQTEGIVLDPVYTGRAMAGLIAAAREADVRPGQRTIFLHSGGLPGFFGHPRAVEWSRSGATSGRHRHG